MPVSIDVTHSTFIIELAPSGLARGAGLGPVGISALADAHSRIEHPQNGESVLFFQMDSTGGQFFEKSMVRRSPTEIEERSELISVVIGSGRKGQTYLYWHDGQLFQLPVSYWTELGCG